MTYETLLIDTPRPHVLLVTMNRPNAANAMNTHLSRDMIDLFEGLALDPGETRCIIVTGAGHRAFCAGGDLKERKGMTDEAWGRQHVVFERMVRALLDCPIPIIGAVNGAAYGGGAEIAATMDFLYAAETARFAMTETSLGIIPGAGGTQTLARAMGERRAKELMMSCRPFSAQEAAEWGLVNAIYPQDTLMNSALDTAEKIAGNAPIAVRQVKQAVHRGLSMSLRDGLAFEIEAYNRTVPTEDRREGVLAFNEKRKAVFRGR